MATGDRRGARRCHDRAEGLPVVGMAMGGDDCLDPIVADEAEQGIRLGRGVDEHLLARLPAAQQVGVVVIGPHGQLGQHQPG